MQQNERKVLEALSADFGIAQDEFLTKEEIHLLLEQRISVLLERNAEDFFQLMYRIDIAEDKLQTILHSADAVTELAKLIYERQMQKIISRQQFSKPPDTDNDLKW